MSSYKMKSLLKGLRYISQVFESEKEPEMKIGNPTNVKHVAHIGCDGPSATAPSWMNEFKAGFGAASNEMVGGEEDNYSAKCMSESGKTRDVPRIPKSTKKSASGSPTKDRPDKTKRRSSNKGSSEEKGRSSRRSKDASGQQLLDQDSWSRHSSLSEIQKKSKRKKSKDSVGGGGGGGGGSSRSSRKSDTDTISDYMSENGSVKSISQHHEERRGF
ncbi:PREDICTED: CRIB domain-containing protein RIC6 [Tarenaya hassleriana]|uniref:CRIB domain-containing protein RIC6 n=1 Tax=Tarenaya hassleriana TaxID=28532 RepID=UPI00053C7601|nr:PREDICTED: CRIB domain-containing protein RIC6 [Tarenaya hassleriana]